MADDAVPNIKHDIMQGYKNSDDNRWPTYDGKFLDRRKFVTASQAGNCERWVWFDKNADVIPLGVDQPAVSGWGYFSRGHSVERWIVDMLRASDSYWDYHYLGKDQVSFYAGNQSGTPDGMARRSTRSKSNAGYYVQKSAGTVLLEFKSYDPRSNTHAFPRSTHKAQVQQNMDVASECLDIDIDKAVIFYNEASDYSVVKSFTIDRDEVEMQKLRDKADKIMAAKLADDMEPEGLYSGQCSLCPFTSLCSDAVSRGKKVTEQARRRRRLADTAFKKKWK